MLAGSAGALDALEEFFGALEPDSRLAIVVVQHLNTDSSEVITSVLAKIAPLPVVEIGESTRMLGGHVYVVPQRSEVRLDNEHVSAMRVADPRQRASILDRGFVSFAEQSKWPLIGIVLSGTGSDGTMGLKAISDAGGMTMVQEPSSAKHDELPRNASAGGNVDHVLPPEQMPAELIAYLDHLEDRADRDGSEAVGEEITAILPRICDELLRVTEHDFRHYKSSTLVRRVLRRMHVLRTKSADEYLNLLRQDRDEAHTLFRELLISVTAFFRDPDTFATLANYVVPKLFELRDEDEAIRVWVPGCATGEEVYTLAMLLCEERQNHDPEIEIQVFGTDIDARALNVARSAAYPLSIADQITETRLARFFTKQAKQYHVKKELRDICVFSVHNLISDPPFSRMHLISCRNLLIYLGQHLQQKLIPLFHFALQPQGYLLLGPSENLTSHTEIFRPVDSKHRISQRKPGPARAMGMSMSDFMRRQVSRSNDAASPNELDIDSVAQRIVLDEFAPRYAVIDEDGQLVSTSTGLERFIEFPQGPFQNNVIKLARPGLRSGLRNAFRDARETMRMVVRDDLTLKSDGGTQRVRLVVQPMPEMGDGGELYMIVFHDLGEVQLRHSSSNLSEAAETTIEQLERELEHTRFDLEKTVQDLEDSNEELKSSNEELRSINEEMKSANEELQTSKEEIQAGMEALSRAQSDLQNLLDGTEIATVFLDSDGKINSFTPSVVGIFNLKSLDVGRPLSDITHNAVSMPTMPSSARIVDATNPAEDEFKLSDGRIFRRRVLPYRHGELVDGTIVTFVDVTDLRNTERRLTTESSITHLLAEAESLDDVDTQILDTMRVNLDATVALLWVLDQDSHQLTCVGSSSIEGSPNLRTFVEFSQATRFAKGEGLPGHVWDLMQPITLEEIGSAEWFIRRALASESGLVSGICMPIVVGKRFRGALEVLCDRQIASHSTLIDALKSVATEIGSFLARTLADARRLEEETRKSAILDAALDCIVTMDFEGRIVDFNPAAERTFGHVAEDVRGRLLVDVIIPEELRDAHRQGLRRYLETGEAKVIGHRLELSALRSDGTTFPVELAISASLTGSGKPFFTAYLRDITDRKESEQRLLRQSQRAEFLAATGAKWALLLDYETTLKEVTKLCVPILADWAFVDLIDSDGTTRRVAVAHADPSHAELAEQVAKFPVERDALDHPPAQGLFGGKGLLISDFTEEMLVKAAQNAEHEQVIRRVDPKSFVVVPLLARGNTIGALTLMASASGRRFDEEDLQLGEELARRAAIAIDNARLFEAGQRANIAKSEFLANMSHEIRTPMTAVLGYADILLADEIDPARSEHLRTIRRNGDFLLEIINDILDLSKIEANKLELKSERFSLQRLIADVHSLMSVRAAEQKLEFSVEYRGSIPEQIENDPHRLKQILINLIGNAIKFTQTGSVRVLVGVDAVCVRFEIVDTGVGMTSEQQRRLFQPFSQGDSSVASVYGGSGLGLAICQRLAKLLGGEITLQSELGRGSNFVCTISAGNISEARLIEPTMVDSIPNPSPSPAVVDETPIRLSCRVLLVDDRRDVRFLAKHLLSKAGADVELAEDGQHALETLEKIMAGELAPVDLILLDMQMPRLDGYQTTVRLREMGFDRPIIALTADAMHGDMNRCIESGCNAYLSKPIDAKELIAMVARLCDPVA